MIRLCSQVSLCPDVPTAICHEAGMALSTRKGCYDKYLTRQSHTITKTRPASSWPVTSTQTGRKWIDGEVDALEMKPICAHSTNSDAKEIAEILHH